jgi:anti-sigma28 factor (negative regulator of flagellin synthesis)
MEIRNNSFKAQPAKNAADFTRPNREAIERGTPDVEDIRAEQARAKAQHAARMEAAEAKETAQRIDAARAVHSERVSKARVVEERKSAAAAPAGDVVDIAADVAGADPAERARMADEAQESERALGARDQASLQAQRAEAARALLTDRASGARDKISLSETSMRLRADAQPSDEAARAERVAELKAHFQQGRLNTDELVARAAYHMLSGE